MLEEAIEVIRELWKGEEVTHDGVFFRSTKRGSSRCPDEPPPIYRRGQRQADR